MGGGGVLLYFKYWGCAFSDNVEGPVLLKYDLGRVACYNMTSYSVIKFTAIV